MAGQPTEAGSHRWRQEGKHIRSHVFPARPAPRRNRAGEGSVPVESQGSVSRPQIAGR